MAKRVQRRRGTTSEHSTFTGYIGETTVDTSKDTVIVHDGSQAGGYPLAREDLSNVTLTNLIGVNELKLTDGTLNQVIKTNGSGTISFGTIDVAGATMGALGGDISGTVANALIRDNKVGIAELNVTDGTNGQALTTNGSGTLSFSNVLTDPALGGHLTGTTSAAVINNNTITSGMLTTALKNFTYDSFTGDGVTTTYTLTDDVGSVNAILAYIDGIVQPTTAYALPTTTSIQFLTAPPTGSVIRCLHLGFQSTVGVPSDGTVTTPKIATNAVTAAKFADGAVATAKLADDAVTEAKIFAQTITNASIFPGTIRSQEIENLTIQGTDIANNAIDGTKIALGSDAQNDLMYYDGTNWARTAGWNYDISFIAGFDSATVKSAVVVQTYGEMVMARTGAFEGEVGYIDTVCTGAVLICDVLKNGTSIYSTKPQFAVSTAVMTAGVLSTTAFASGDRVTFKVTQIGSTVAGEGVRFMLKCKA
ncbi:MAG: hypothetical protein CMF86_00315 [Candidatus Marinimicrobia bacterium]|nr:hypothetical protein [Candidatus Neomarinimicrobiota bacterium]|tara:strand:+ start:185 stop:1618 length:1434 start_codon:yes stop_codon:yes gene_type:complete